MTEFTKKVSDRVKTFKCSKESCRSDNEDNMEVVVFGDDPTATKRGFMCSSCFLSDPAMISEFKGGKSTAIPISKFMKSLNEFYEGYRKLKTSTQWQPSLSQEKTKEIKVLLASIDNEISRKINQILNGVYKEVEIAVNELKTNNKDNDFQKIVEFLKQEKPVDISGTLSSLSQRIVKLDSEYSYSGEEEVRQGNERIALRIGSIIKLAEETINKLIELQKKQIQFILSS